MKNSSHATKQKFHPPSRWLATLLGLLLMSVMTASIASVSASLDRSTVYAGDTLTLTIEGEGQDSGLQPELSPLKRDFIVLGTGTSSQVSIINGRRSDKTLWRIQLQPRRSGKLKIPPLRVGKQKTAAIEVNITDEPEQLTTQGNQHILIKAEINSTGKPTYVQQQIPYTVFLYYDDSLQEGELKAPEVPDATIEQLGEDKSYTTVRNGKQYNVVERHYVISPEKSGTLNIPSATFTGRILTLQTNRQKSHGSSMMDNFLANSPFANDPFFRNSLINKSFFGNYGKPVSMRSRAISMEIKARPAAAHNWIPAESLVLTDNWTKQAPQFKVGEPVSRKITIQGKGLSGSQLPDLKISTPANARLYPDPPKLESRTDGNTIYGIRTQTITYIPATEGKLDIPAISIDWWDTRNNKAASTSLPALQFRIAPPAAGTAESTIETGAGKSARALPNAAADKKAIPVETAARRWLSRLLPDNFTKDWRLLLAVSSLLIVLIILLILRYTQHRHNQTEEKLPAGEIQTAQNKRPDRKSALHRLQQACQVNDKLAAVNALLELAEIKWPDNPPRNLDQLAVRLEHGQSELRELERSLYAANAGSWDGSSLYQEFRQGLREKKMTIHGLDDGLNPLYPQHS